MKQTAVVEVGESLIHAIAPFVPDDGSKGTYLTLLIGGMDPAPAMKAVGRKARTLSLWRTTDPDFERLEKIVKHFPPDLAAQARVLRASKMDLGLVEVTNSLIARAIRHEHIPDASWAFLSKMASMRIPLMLDHASGTSSWDKLTQVLQPVFTQRELKVENTNGSKLTATEKSVDMSKMGIDIIRGVLGGNHESD